MISIDRERGEEREVEVASGDACDAFFFFFACLMGLGLWRKKNRSVGPLMSLG